jgi:hypothetical protein
VSPSGALLTETEMVRITGVGGDWPNRGGLAPSMPASARQSPPNATSTPTARSVTSFPGSYTPERATTPSARPPGRSSLACHGADADSPAALKVTRAARAAARQQARMLADCQAPGADGGQVLVDIERPS